MTQSKKIALTGGIGSGKSVALALLGKWGYPVFSCDEIYAELCGDEEFLRGLSALFPFAVRENALDRAALSAVIFSDGEARKKLDAYTHPRIMRRLLAQMEAYPLSFAEVPLLFEGGYEGLFDGVIVLQRDKAARIAAVMKRSGLSEAETSARIDSQFRYEQLPADCFVLPNNGSKEELSQALLQIVSKL